MVHSGSTLVTVIGEFFGLGSDRLTSNLFNTTLCRFGLTVTSTPNSVSSTRIVCPVTINTDNATPVLLYISIDSGVSWTSAPELLLLSAPPTIQALSQTRVLVGISTSMVITGSGFTFSSAVLCRFGGADIRMARDVGSTSITCVTPQYTTPSTGVSFAVSINNGTDWVGGMTFDIIAAPTITSVWPRLVTVGNSSTIVTVSGMRLVNSFETPVVFLCMACCLVSTHHTRYFS